ncbi:MAG: 4'-phosphopantetheinyl transferase superfamily protein [Lachnospiraceae bacterium]|nr:4'-phosphopantetheinyl transferase superfamily protein [Lachnospiraceae bacterium]
MLNIYLADLAGPEDFYNKKVNILHQERAEKIGAYKMSADRIRGLGAGLLLERGLEGYLADLRANEEVNGRDGNNKCNPSYAIPKDEEGRYIIHYGYGPQGKPYLIDYPGIYFSLSHSGNMAVLAISNSEVGIDVQERRGYQEKVVKRFYHESEIAVIEAISDPAEKANCFYKMWTGKEAYIKYTGKGMGQDLRSFGVDLVNECILEDGKKVALCKTIRMESNDYFCSLVCDIKLQKIDKISKIQL